MRVVIFQGQYGVFSTRYLSLSMPAVQTCIGVVALHHSRKWATAAHFDTALGLKRNLEEWELAMNARTGSSGLRDWTFTLFGGDGALSLLRCGKPSTYIGVAIQQHVQSKGATAVYSAFYSQLLPQTWCLTLRTDQIDIAAAEYNPAQFAGHSHSAKTLAMARVFVRPDQYTPAQAVMRDVSCFYQT